jgi:hypothetical protein
MQRDFRSNENGDAYVTFKKFEISIASSSPPLPSKSRRAFAEQST